MKNPAAGLLAHIRKATKLGEYILAEKLLLDLISLKPEFAHAYTLLGNVYELSGDRTKASDRYKQAIEIKPDNAEAYNNLGIVFKNQERYKEALASLFKALDIAGERADIHYNIANVYKEMSQPDKAIEEYDTAIRLDPSFALPYNNLGIILESLGRIEDAAETYSRGLMADTNNPRLRTNLGVVLEKQGNLPRAREELTKALRARPGKIEVMQRLASVLGKLGRHKDAIALYNDILKIDTENIRATNNLGIEYVKAGEIAKASSSYQRALAIDPGYVTAHFNLGSILLEEGYYSEALSEIEKVLHANPGDRKARFELGNAHLSLGHFHEAEEAFLAVLADTPKDTSALRALGNLSLKLGTYEKADDYFKKAMREEKANSSFKVEFARALRNKDEYEKSKEEISAFLSLHPEDAQAETLLGELCLRQGDIEAARVAFESAITKKPMIVEPYYLLARLYRDSGNPKKAIEVLDKLISIHGTRAASFDLLSLNEALSLYEEVASQYERDNKLFEKRKYAIDGLRFDETENERGRTGGDSLYAVYGDKPGDAAILSVGVTEPAIPVKEEERVLRIVKSTAKGTVEGITEKTTEGTVVGATEGVSPVVNIEDSEPPPFKELLRNQIVYEEIGKIQEWAVQHQRRRFIDVFGTEGYGTIKNSGEKENIREDNRKRDTTMNVPGYLQNTGSAGGEKLSETQQGIIEKVMDGMGNIMKALYDRKTATEPPSPEPEEARDERRHRRRKKKEKHFTADKASGLLLEQEKREKEISRLAPIPTVKNLREKLHEYIRRIRHKLDSGAPLEIPEDEQERERIRKLVDGAHEMPKFDEGKEKSVSPASDIFPLTEAPVTHKKEETKPREDRTFKETRTRHREEIERQIKEIESTPSRKKEKDKIASPEEKLIPTDRTTHEEVLSIEPETDVLRDNEDEDSYKNGGYIDAHKSTIGDDVESDFEPSFIEPDTYNTYDSSGKDEEDTASDLNVIDKQFVMHIEKKKEPVALRVVEGVLAIISKLLVIIPIPGVRNNLRNKINGFIMKLYAATKKK